MDAPFEPGSSPRPDDFRAEEGFQNDVSEAVDSFPQPQNIGKELVSKSSEDSNDPNYGRTDLDIDSSHRTSVHEHHRIKRPKRSWFTKFIGFFLKVPDHQQTKTVYPMILRPSSDIPYWEGGGCLSICPAKSEVVVFKSDAVRVESKEYVPLDTKGKGKKEVVQKPQYYSAPPINRQEVATIFGPETGDVYTKDLPKVEPSKPVQESSLSSTTLSESRAEGIEALDAHQTSRNATEAKAEVGKELSGSHSGIFSGGSTSSFDATVYDDVGGELHKVLTPEYVLKYMNDFQRRVKHLHREREVDPEMHDHRDLEWEIIHEIHKDDPDSAMGMLIDFYIDRAEALIYSKLHDSGHWKSFIKFRKKFRTRLRNLLTAAQQVRRGRLSSVQRVLYLIVQKPCLLLARSFASVIKLSQIPRLLLALEKRLLDQPSPSYQLRPVIFSLDLAHYASGNNAFRDLYDHAFLVMKKSRPNPTRGCPNPLRYIAAAHVVTLNRDDVTDPSIKITESFNLFASKGVESAIIFTNDVCSLEKNFLSAVHSVFGCTDIGHTPLLIFFLKLAKDKRHKKALRNNRYMRRLAGVQENALKEKLMQDSLLHSHVKAYCVREEFVEKDVRKGVKWLWRESGLYGNVFLESLGPAEKAAYEERMVRARGVQEEAADVYKVPLFRRKSTKKSMLKIKTMNPFEEAGLIVSSKKKVKIIPMPVDTEEQIKRSVSSTNFLMIRNQVIETRRLHRKQRRRSLSQHRLQQLEENVLMIRQKFHEYKSRFLKFALDSSRFNGGETADEFKKSVRNELKIDQTDVEQLAFLARKTHDEETVTDMKEHVKRREEWKKKDTSILQKSLKMAEMKSENLIEDINAIIEKLKSVHVVLEDPIEIPTFVYPSEDDNLDEHRTFDRKRGFAI